MKPELEILSKQVEKKSFYFFKTKQGAFEPYWHYHPEVELTYIIRGEGTRFVGNNISNYQAGDLVLIGENLPHHWVSFQSNSDSIQEAIVIQFLKKDLILYPELIHIINLLDKAKLGLYFKQPNPEIYHQLKKLVDQKPPRQLLSILDILHMLTDEENESLSTIEYRLSEKNNEQQVRVDSITKYLLENLERKITLDEISNKAHMTPPSFCRWFKKSVGNSFTSFLNGARIEQACQYLITTQMPINEIALRVGFESPTHFNRTFKSYKKIQPRKYRKERLFQ